MCIASTDRELKLEVQLTFAIHVPVHARVPSSGRVEVFLANAYCIDNPYSAADICC